MSLNDSPHELPTREWFAGFLGRFHAKALHNPSAWEEAVDELEARLRPTWHDPNTAHADCIEKENALRAELARVNNEFGSMTAEWPNAWERVAALKESNRALRADLERAQSERDEARAVRITDSVHEANLATIQRQHEKISRLEARVLEVNHQHSLTIQALDADLRACAEALTKIEKATYDPDERRMWEVVIECHQAAETALARPGVQRAHLAQEPRT